MRWLKKYLLEYNLKLSASKSETWTPQQFEQYTRMRLYKERGWW